MPIWTTRDCGTTRGRCGSCGSLAELRLTESSYERTWRDTFRGSIDDRVDRRVTCSACERTYPVRSADGSPMPSTARVETTRPPAAASQPRWGRRATDRGEPAAPAPEGIPERRAGSAETAAERLRRRRREPPVH